MKFHVGDPVIECEKCKGSDRPRCSRCNHRLTGKIMPNDTTECEYCLKQNRIYVAYADQGDSDG